MFPTTSFGVIPESEPGAWRGISAADPIVNCAVCSDLMCVHATAGWLVLRKNDAYRAAAGVDPRKGGLSIQASTKALRALYPELDITTLVYATTTKGIDVANHIATAGIAASVSTMAGKLPDHGSYLDKHRVAVVGKGPGVLVVGNPLKDSYSNWTPITPAQLAVAIDAYPKSEGVGGVIYFPTVDQAFTKHPLYKAPADATEQQLAEARSIGFTQGKTKAAAAAAAVTEA